MALQTHVAIVWISLGNTLLYSQFWRHLQMLSLWTFPQVILFIQGRSQPMNIGVAEVYQKGTNRKDANFCIQSIATVHTSSKESYQVVL
jgi:hypothetical protein